MLSTFAFFSLYCGRPSSRSIHHQSVMQNKTSLFFRTRKLRSCDRHLTFSEEGCGLSIYIFISSYDAATLVRLARGARLFLDLHHHHIEDVPCVSSAPSNSSPLTNVLVVLARTFHETAAPIFRELLPLFGGDFPAVV